MPRPTSLSPASQSIGRAKDCSLRSSNWCGQHLAVPPSNPVPPDQGYQVICLLVFVHFCACVFNISTVPHPFESPFVLREVVDQQHLSLQAADSSKTRFQDGFEGARSSYPLRCLFFVLADWSTKWSQQWGEQNYQQKKLSCQQTKMCALNHLRNSVRDLPYSWDKNVPLSGVTYSPLLSHSWKIAWLLSNFNPNCGGKTNDNIQHTNGTWSPTGSGIEALQATSCQKSLRVKQLVSLESFSAFRGAFQRVPCLDPSVPSRTTIQAGRE